MRHLRKRFGSYSDGSDMMSTFAVFFRLSIEILSAAAHPRFASENSFVQKKVSENIFKKFFLTFFPL